MSASPAEAASAVVRRILGVSRRAWSLLPLLLISSRLAGQTFELTIKDAFTGEPIRDAEAVLSGVIVNRSRSAWSDVEGRVRFPVVPGDTVTVSVAALGYESQSNTVITAPGPYSAIVWLQLAPIEISGVRLTVPTQRVLLSLRAFERRRSRGFGGFMGPEELSGIVASDASDYIRRIPSIQLLGGTEPIFRRGGSGFRLTRCLPVLVLDGLVVRDVNSSTIRFDDVVPATNIAAIEAYAGPAGLPPEFAGSSSACGVILIWTKSW